jgi:hypothetical protein
MLVPPDLAALVEALPVRGLSSARWGYQRRQTGAAPMVSRLRKQLADRLTACEDCSPYWPPVHIWSAMGSRSRIRHSAPGVHHGSLRVGRPMPRTMIGLLAAVGAAVSGLIGLVHGSLSWLGGWSTPGPQGCLGGLPGVGSGQRRTVDDIAGRACL